MKRAVILFNLGGPDSLDAVQPFLFNLFNDPAIIKLPNPLRYLVAKLISSRRAPKTKEIYKEIGNRSPLLELTKDQANALESLLNDSESKKDDLWKSFIVMRYWHPFATEVVEQVKQFQPDEVILLPLYPQFSTTTTGSSVKDWQKFAKKAGLDVPTKIMGCYPKEAEFLKAHAEIILQSIHKSNHQDHIRILFSAHGLPQKIVDSGDPYQWQIEQTVGGVLDVLKDRLRQQGKSEQIDYVVCYQSRVGPLQWIGPSTEDEIKRAGMDKKTIIITPIAFISEHSETLVELDMEYKHLADEASVIEYIRVPALGVNELFIKSLKNLCLKLAEKTSAGRDNYCGKRICANQFSKCFCFPKR